MQWSQEAYKIWYLMFRFDYNDFHASDYMIHLCRGAYWKVDEIPDYSGSRNSRIVRKIKLFAIVSIFYCMQKRSTEHQFEQFCQAFDGSCFDLDKTFEQYTPDQILAIENYLAG